ncbi:AraC family transcriptional regulator [Gilvimarinus xylanilyticus]|uniref:AraC family transcriptional regulator n=1 Tax=Gilvimarinus xylanilyticus TaxID=2944139 RepID=A0A9X2I332_9GAMM|nr:AraC family transcriptional regulator [Gilvimarinus xylanilyticus]MCP8899435.1 AraC family transcriptional regulator [Gilvimarinus xylanilyticus]
MTLWYENDTPCIAAHEFPAALIDLACSRDLEPDRLLRGTGIFMADFLSASLIIKPVQCYALLRNIQRLMPASDTAFLAGHRLFPGNFGPASTALTQASHLLDALQTLENYSALLSPLLQPRLSLDSDFVYLYWQESCEASDQGAFLRDMLMTAITSLSRQLYQQSLPWEYFLPGELTHPEQYSVNWGPRVYSKRHITAMRLPRELATQNTPMATTSAATIAKRQCEVLFKDKPSEGFISHIDQRIRRSIPGHVSLESLAQALEVSPATLKRKLKKHHTHFQQRYDNVRKELAIEWLTRQELSVEDIAARLHFHDSRNLRRAFKRWTGVLPSALSASV